MGFLGRVGVCRDENDGDTVCIGVALQPLAHVVADATGDRYIAGLIFLSQHSLASSQGFINFIDYYE